MGSVLIVIAGLFLVYLAVKVTWWFIKLVIFAIAIWLVVGCIGIGGLLVLVLAYLLLKEIFG